MKILYYCPEYYGAHGGRTHARGFFNALKSIPEVSDAILYPIVDPAVELSETKTSSSPKRKKLRFLPRSLRRIVYFLRPRYNLTRELIDIINTHSCDVIIIRTGISHPVFREIKNACPNTLLCLEVNAAFFDEAFPALPFKKFFQSIELSRYKEADAVIAVSTYLKNYLVRYGMSSNIILVNQNGFDPETIANQKSRNNGIRQRYEIPDDAFLIGYIGGMEKFRRLPEVVKHIVEIRKLGNEDVYFLVVGDGADMPAVESMIMKYHDILGGSIKLAGWVEHSEVSRYLTSFDIAIFPFTNEYCSPLKLFEYLGFGLPSIGPDTAAVREVFKDGSHISLVKQDGSNFVDAVLELKHNSSFRERIAKDGRQHVLDNYTWVKNAQRAIDHITKLSVRRFPRAHD